MMINETITNVCVCDKEQIKSMKYKNESPPLTLRIIKGSHNASARIRSILFAIYIV